MLQGVQTLHESQERFQRGSYGVKCILLWAFGGLCGRRMALFFFPEPKNQGQAKSWHFLALKMAEKHRMRQLVLCTAIPRPSSLAEPGKRCDRVGGR